MTNEHKGHQAHHDKPAHSYVDESKAKGGSVPPDLRRNSKSRSRATQEQLMGGHNKQEQKELQRERAHQVEQDVDREAENY
ncbi:MAG: hypothetical protein ACK46X_08620 [Candidatus Sericytochromatia bacterium]